MRIRLKGINKVTKRLSSGDLVTYYYAWKGGPRLEGKPGSPEFIASFNKAAGEKPANLTSGKVLSNLIDAYRDSEDFRILAPRTRIDYAKLLEKIEEEFGDFPVKALADQASRADFMEWRDKLARASHRQADYAWTVLSRIMSWSVNRGLAPANPCAKGGRFYDGSRAEKIWSAEDEKAFLAKASPGLSLAILLALWTGQRQGDLLALTWFAYDGAYIRLRQSKTKRRVTIPVGAPLKEALDRCATPRAGKILLTSAGKEWTPDGFRVSWRKTCAKAGISGLTFHDLRGTAVTRLFVAGCTEAEVATITGLSLKAVQSILDRHYFHRDLALAESGIKKLEKSVGKKQVTD